MAEPGHPPRNGRRKNGTEFPVDIIAIVRDITQRKWVQEALRKSIRGAGDARFLESLDALVG